MDRGERTLAPEWLKASGTSSHSDEHTTGTSSRTRLALTASDHDASRAPSFSFRRSSSNNDSIGNDRDSYGHSRGYSSFGRSNRDRDRDRGRDRQMDREKEISLLDNGYEDFSDSLFTRRTEKGTLRRSHPMVSGRRVDTLPKRPVSDTSGGLSKVSFERDFPSLGAEEKQQGFPDIPRGSSPGISSAINSLHINTSAIIGANGWTSALAEVPAVSLSNGSSVPSLNMASSALSSSTGLSMAETLAQAPLRARNAPLLSNDSERLKEQTLLQQYNKLIPVKPQGSKNLVPNSSDKSKLKGPRNGDLVTSKVVLPATRPDALKTPQASNFLVLNRDKSSTAPNQLLTTTNKVATLSASVPHLKPNANGTAIEKKPQSQDANQKRKANGKAQNKNEFFNSLRKQAEIKNGSLSSSASVSNLVINSDEPNFLATSNSGVECSVSENGKIVNEEPEISVSLNEEEIAFMESLGWEQNAAGDDGALTAEEIASFINKHKEKLRPDFKY